MLPMPCCSNTMAWAWLIATGPGVGLVTALFIREVSPAYAHGRLAKVILLGVIGAAAGAASAKELALFTPSPTVVALCALMGSLVVLDLNHLMRRKRR